MTKSEMIARTREALARFDQLPPEEQARRLMASHTIDEQGRVLLGGDEGRVGETPASYGNGDGKGRDEK